MSLVPSVTLRLSKHFGQCFFFSHVLAEIQPRSPRSGENFQPRFSAKTAAEGGEIFQPRFSGFSAKIAAEGGRKFSVPLYFCSKKSVSCGGKV